MFDHFTSDWHLGHKNILTYSQRPFRTIEEHDRELVDRFNAHVKPGESSLILGDFLFGNVSRGREIVESLNGEVHCVRGNHDGTLRRLERMGFAGVWDDYTLVLEGIPVHCSHYPPYRGRDKGTYMDRRPKALPGYVYLHGHTHSIERIRGRAVHVGVDAWDYRPVSLIGILGLLWLASGSEEV